MPQSISPKFLHQAPNLLLFHRFGFSEWIEELLILKFNFRNCVSGYFCCLSNWVTSLSWSCGQRPCLITNSQHYTWHHMQSLVLSASFRPTLPNTDSLSSASAFRSWGYGTCMFKCTLLKSPSVCPFQFLCDRFPSAASPCFAFSSSLLTCFDAVPRNAMFFRRGTIATGLSGISHLYIFVFELCSCFSL